MTTQPKIVQSLRLGALTLSDFLAYTGWHPVISRDRMRIALEFYQRTVPSGVLAREESDPSPWALPSARPGQPKPPTLRLTQWMQAIDFRHPVEPATLAPGVRLKAFWTRHNSSVGRWFTELEGRYETLAIPGNQQIPIIFEVVRTLRCLKSTVSDAYVDWARNSSVDPSRPEYRHGGGVQMFIWDPECYLCQSRA